MTCPVCGAETCVINSVKGKKYVYRERKCLKSADHRFTTIEYIDDRAKDAIAKLRYKQRKINVKK